MHLYFPVTGMGENACSWTRKISIQRDSMLAAAAIYKGIVLNVI